MSNTKFHIGTAGWSNEDWITNFYPKAQTGQFDWLQFYSHYFNFVGVNSSYYAYISPRVVHGWIEKVSDVNDFQFSIKLHQDVTHKRNYDQQKIAAVHFDLDLLHKAERFGGLLIQFPYSFPFNENNMNYISHLREHFEKFNCFVEVRHQSWFNEKVFDIFKKLDVSYTVIDQPPIGNALPFKPTAANDNVHIRFHGRNRQAWQKSINNFGSEQTFEEKNERYDYLYSPGELKEFELAIDHLLKNSVKEIYIIFNNHHHGQAAANVFEFISYLEERLVEIPKTTLTAFPRLSQISLT
jgi:uncharacterized protein YecE (DUF72 family)